jgi:hypothetical protein
MSGFSFAVGNKKKTPFQVGRGKKAKKAAKLQDSLLSLPYVLQRHKEQEEEKKRVRVTRRLKQSLSFWSLLSLLLSPAASCCLMVQKADAEAAKLYEDFVESFAEDPAEKGPKAFVRGEVIQPGQRPSDSGANLQHNKNCFVTYAA